MIRTVIPFTLFALLSACGQSIPIQSDGPVAKTASDQPGGGLLVGTWLRVGSVEGILVEFQQETLGTLVDSLIITPRDGVAYELTYREKTIKLEGWDQIDESACIENRWNRRLCGVPDAKSPTKNLYANGWGRLRIQDNGRGHIRYDQWQDYYSKGERVADDYVRIFHDKRFIVWDDRLILWDGEDNEIQYVRSTQ